MAYLTNAVYESAERVIVHAFPIHTHHPRMPYLGLIFTVLLLIASQILSRYTKNFRTLLVIVSSAPTRILN